MKMFSVWSPAFRLRRAAPGHSTLKSAPLLTRWFLILLIALLLAPEAARAVPVTPHTPVAIIKLPGNAYQLTWQGLPGYTYFFQATTTPSDAASWTYCPFVEQGTGTAISFGCSAPANGQRWFLRLKYTDRYLEGGDARYADYDGDGVPNLIEVSGPGSGINTGTGTDPCVADIFPDTDNDGMKDAVERYYWGHITNPDALADADGDGIPNALEIASGTSPLAVPSTALPARTDITYDVMGRLDAVLTSGVTEFGPLFDAEGNLLLRQ